MKSFLPLLAIIFAFLVPSTCIALESDSPVKSPPTPNQPQQERSPKTRLWITSVHQRARHNGYVVDVRYPLIKGEPASLVRRLNRRVKRLVDMNIPAKPGKQGCLNYYKCSYRSGLVTGEVISLDFDFNPDPETERGASYHVPFNFQLSPHLRRLTLRRIFDKSVDYGLLSDLCETELQLKLKGNLLLPANTLLANDALSNFLLEKKGITFTFPEGYVAATALGCPAVTISYDKVRRLFSRRSPLNNIAAKRHRTLFSHFRKRTKRNQLTR